MYYILCILKISQDNCTNIPNGTVQLEGIVFIVCILTNIFIFNLKC